MDVSPITVHKQQVPCLYLPYRCFAWNDKQACVPICKCPSNNIMRTCLYLGDYPYGSGQVLILQVLGLSVNVSNGSMRHLECTPLCVLQLAHASDAQLQQLKSRHLESELSCKHYLPSQENVHFNLGSWTSDE